MKIRWLIGAIGIAAASQSNAAILLDFEGVGNLSDISQFYNGGTDSAGHSGTNYGVSFSSLVTGLIDQDDGGTGNIANEPSSKTVMANFGTGAAILNIGAGFTDSLSLYYSTQTDLHILAYSGLDGTGDVLGQIDVNDFIPQNELTCSGDPTGQFCNWTQIAMNFGGVAKSVTFQGGSANQANYAIDNVTLGASNVSAVPEPASWAMMIAGFGLVGSAMRSTRKSRIVVRFG